MEQISNETQIFLSVQKVYDILSSLQYLNIRYAGYKEHSIMNEAPNMKTLRIKVTGLDGNEYSWVVEEYYNQCEKVLMCERRTQLEPFEYFRSIYKVSGKTDFCTLVNIKEFEIKENSNLQLNQVLPSLKMAAKKSIEQIRYELENNLWEKSLS